MPPAAANWACPSLRGRDHDDGIDSRSRGVQVTRRSVEAYIHPPLSAAAGWVPSAEEVIVLRGPAACVSARPGAMKNWTAAPRIGAIVCFLISVSLNQTPYPGGVIPHPAGPVTTSKR